MAAIASTSALLATQPASAISQYLTFVLRSETYALGILNIKEIIDYGNLTEVPMMPSFVRGVINLRGSVVPIVDLNARFGKENTQIAKRTGIIIIETAAEEEHINTQDLGIIVDAVNEVIEINQTEIEPPPNFGTGIRPDFINGMAKRDGRFIILLNVNRVLSVSEMASLTTHSDKEHGGA